MLNPRPLIHGLLQMPLHLINERRGLIRQQQESLLLARMTAAMCVEKRPQQCQKVSFLLASNVCQHSIAVLHANKNTGACIARFASQRSMPLVTGTVGQRSVTCEPR